MRIKTEKTKIMRIGRERAVVIMMTKVLKLEQVESCKYLVNLFTWNRGFMENIQSRIAHGKINFRESNNVKK